VVKAAACEWNASIVDAPKGRRGDFVTHYFRKAGLARRYPEGEKTHAIKSGDHRRAVVTRLAARPTQEGAP